MDDLYQEHILDHYKHPRNAGSITQAHEGELMRAHASNAGCGDDIDADFIVSGGIITAMKWRGTGCAISQSAMSIISEWVIGKKLREVHALTVSQVLKLMGLSEVAMAREKCVSLPLQLF